MLYNVKLEMLACLLNCPFPYRCIKQAHITLKERAAILLKANISLEYTKWTGTTIQHAHKPEDQWNFFSCNCKGFKGRCAQPPLF